MKKLIRILALSALVATLWLPALAQTTQPATTTPATQGDEEAKNAMYQKFLDNYKTNPKVAYDTAKEYLQKWPAETEQTAYMKKYIVAYDVKEKNDRKAAVGKFFTEKKYGESFQAAKAVLAQEPDDIGTLINAVFAAFYAAGVDKNESYNAEASGYARKAIQLIQSGKPVDKKDETLGYLNSALGFFTLKTNPSEAVTSYIKAAQFEGATKKDPQTYLFLADAYRAAEYTKLAGDIKTRCSTAEQQATPECKALSDRLNVVVDRMIDAYARAVALATDAKFAQAKTEWMKDLTNLYKFRHENSEAGLNEFIAGILAKPLPSEPIGTATTPAPATSSTTGAATTTTAPATTPTTTSGTTAKPNTTATGNTGRPPRR